MISNKIKRYRRLFEGSEGRIVWITYIRQEVEMENGIRYNNWIFTGKVIKVTKKSISILLNGEKKVDIGFRNIKESIFLDTCLKIKLKLYGNGK